MLKSEHIVTNPIFIDIQEHQCELANLIEQVQQHGKVVIITKAGQPQVQIMPVTATVSRRQMGTLKHQLPTSIDTLFSKEMEEKVERLFLED